MDGTILPIKQSQTEQFLEKYRERKVEHSETELRKNTQQQLVREAKRSRALASAYLTEQFPLICPEEISVLLEENGKQICNFAEKHYLKRTIKHGGVSLCSSGGAVAVSVCFIAFVVANPNPASLTEIFVACGAFFGFLAGLIGFIAPFVVFFEKFFNSLSFWRNGSL